MAHLIVDFCPQTEVSGHGLSQLRPVPPGMRPRPHRFHRNHCDGARIGLGGRHAYLDRASPRPRNERATAIGTVRLERAPAVGVKDGREARAPSLCRLVTVSGRLDHLPDSGAAHLAAPQRDLRLELIEENQPLFSVRLHLPHHHREERGMRVGVLLAAGARGRRNDADGRRSRCKRSRSGRWRQRP